MRIKIKGEITAERLAEALHAAAEKYEAVRPGHKVYGANLYLTAFDHHRGQVWRTGKTSTHSRG